jgi:urea carboxylase
MALNIINPGLSTSIQDLGRPGYFHLGIPIGGAMDRFSMRVANMLVGNPEEAAGLEAVFMGPEIEFTNDTAIAITGADIPVMIDGVEQPTWTALAVSKGQKLSFGFLKAGARLYIAIAGGITTPEALGSRSTYPIGALGGFEGRNIAAGDTLPTGTGGNVNIGATVAPDMRRMPANPAILRMVKGLYWHRLTEASGAQFLSDEWKVAPEADRMGYRFRGGQALEFVDREQPFGAGSDPSNIVDGCYSYGSIQVPGGTEPIVLHRDAVSGGGYFTLGAIISADMDFIGQLQPHTPVKFEAVSMDEALSARKERHKQLDTIRAELS